MTNANHSRPDLVIRNGRIADGLGSSLFSGDIAVSNGVILSVGQVCEAGIEEIDAGGALVTPGFIDVHTHYDGQAVWSDRFSPSSSHGVTTVVMGNCGVGFAPCRREDHDVLVSVMEGVEDVPEIVMTTGLDWSWQTFPEFLDVVDKRQHDIDFAMYLPHSPLRVYVMGERGARREAATPGDLEEMQSLMREALEAGALGFATSNVPVHRTGKGDYIPSFQSEEREYLAIAGVLRETGRGVFQMVLDQRKPADSYMPMLQRLSQVSGQTVTFSFVQMMDMPPSSFTDILEAVHEANAVEGVAIHPQVYPRPIGMLLGHDLSLNPFSLCPSYQPLLNLPLEERVAALRDPALRAKLLTEPATDPTNPLLTIGRDFKRLYPFRTPADYEPAPENAIARLSATTGRPPLEIAYDLLLENEGRGMIFAASCNYLNGSLDDVLQMIDHPDTVIGLGDGGAHYGLICDAAFPTFVLTHWTRDRNGKKMAVTDAIKALTSSPAKLVGLNDRGVLAPGYKADINIIDYDALKLSMPHTEYDLPGGGRRLNQLAKGYRATIVSGSVIAHNDQPTGNMPGRLVRGQRPTPTAQNAMAR